MKALSVLRVSKSMLELFSLIAMAAVFVLFALIFKNYPANTTNAIMLFGRGFTMAKITLFVLLLICAGINASLFVVSRFPSLYKYPFKINADNIEIQYHLAKIVLSVVQILVSVLFWILFLKMYSSALHETSLFPLNIILSFCILIAATVGVYFLLAFRYK